MVEACATSPSRPTGEPAEPRAPQAHLEGLIGQLYDALEAADYFHPPDRTPATKNTIRTILTKAGLVFTRGSGAARHRPRSGRAPTPRHLTRSGFHAK